MKTCDVKKLWEDSGRKARVEIEKEGEWKVVTDPFFDALRPYRIHPDDMHLCKTPRKFDHARNMIAAIEAGKDLQEFVLGEWRTNLRPLSERLFLLNDPTKTRIKPNTVTKRLLLLRKKIDGEWIYDSVTAEKKLESWEVVKEIDVEEER